jgi:hypothetical protein
MFGALDSLVSVPDDSFTKSGSDMLTSMWNRPGFETNKQHFLDKLGIGYASRNRIACLIKKNADINILPEIIKSLNQEQMQSIMEEDKSIHEIFTRIRNRQLGGRGDSQSPGSLLDVDTLQQKGTDVRSKV